MRVRLGVAIALTMIVAPAVVLPTSFDTASFDGFLRAVPSETITGLCLGFAVRLTIWILQMVGTIAAQSTSLSQILGAAAVDPQPAIAQVFAVAGLALAMMAGLHNRVAEALIESYALVPMGSFLASAETVGWAVSEVAGAFDLSFSLAAPFAIASLLYNMALGAINRAMPQLMVAFVGAPAITAGGLALLAIAAPFVLSLWLTRFESAVVAPFGVVP